MVTILDGLGFPVIEFVLKIIMVIWIVSASNPNELDILINVPLATKKNDVDGPFA